MPETCHKSDKRHLYTGPKGFLWEPRAPFQSKPHPFKFPSFQSHSTAMPPKKTGTPAMTPSRPKNSPSSTQAKKKKTPIAWDKDGAGCTADQEDSLLGRRGCTVNQEGILLAGEACARGVGLRLSTPETDPTAKLFINKLHYNTLTPKEKCSYKNKEGEELSYFAAREYKITEQEIVFSKKLAKELAKQREVFAKQLAQIRQTLQSKGVDPSILDNLLFFK
ncbi:uncharacterized protein PGTG_11694 [Puccinia graminis f. sp. tritici CRL 75-36-700-3]|uniref:Uncharacterized protein n=1 Tax=Puccinia graminis f. sp. tritici (strain CRL 75-36-700-3 / race SCCL) TaxID=418459 RepID=E3KNR3_PUCGT|nr:uncharacterized protein PGTG_11694 [Puccinia graminis f. sp. tritici CRL 75-36-700-3]EFP85938.1 hypothetical protein PGTG_11694 [Puccinia graminis f. sp. tritici CRL 75-36-700-3]